MKYLQTYNESLRDQMTPKSEEEMINIVNNLSLEEKKHFIFILYVSSFDNKERFYNYIKLMLGISVWNRIIKHIHKYSYPMDVIQVLNKYEVDKLIKLLLNKDKTTNESLRNKMTPKSEEEILKSLNADPNVSYKSVKKTIGGSWLIGEYITTYDVLIKLFGKPKKEDWVGNNFLWTLEANNGHLITIYDNNSGLNSEKLKTQTYRWHIGGTDPQDANNLIGYIIKNTN